MKKKTTQIHIYRDYLDKCTATAQKIYCEKQKKKKKNAKRKEKKNARRSEKKRINKIKWNEIERCE